MDFMDNDEDIFAQYADNIYTAQETAREEFFSGINNEETKQEEIDFMAQVKEKLKKKPRGKKGNKKVPPSVIEDEVVQQVSTRSSRRKRELNAKDIIADLIDEKNAPIAANLNLPAVAKRRLKELRLNTAREKKRVDEEYNQILELDRSLSSKPADEEEENEILQNITLRIRYISNVERFTVPIEEKFGIIITKVAAKFDLKASEILLFLDDKNIDLADTPKSLDLNASDIIDCIPYKPQDSQDPNKLLIRIQSGDSRKKVEMYAHKLEPLSKLIWQYAEEKKLDVQNLKFEFDGETIEGSETPEDLDMESGSCVDVSTVANNGPANLQNTGPDSPEIINVFDEDDYPLRNDMLNIVVLE